jgi:DNA-cytosine methyltransferase
MENKINVLSLFDGCSCGRQALERAGIEVNQYFASEIDKYAIQVTMANYPDTIQLGSVVNVDGKSLPKIELLLGGSPCTNFSFAGKRKGMSTKDEQEILTLEHYLQLKTEGFEFEGQSYLFWEYMRLLNEVKPTYFLLENVEMGEKWEKVLSKAIGYNGIHINSALVSAQNRKRIYWTNIGMQPAGLFGDLESIIQQPKDRGILLKDILQDNPNAKYYISSKMEEHLNSRDSVKIKNGEDKSGTITTNGEGKQGNNSTFICQEVDEKYFLSESLISKLHVYNQRQIDNGNGFMAKFRDTNVVEKMDCIKIGGGMKDDLIVHNTMPRSSTTGKGGTGPLSRNDGKTYCLDTKNTNALEIVCGQLGYDKPFEENDKAQALLQRDYKGMSNYGINVVVNANGAKEQVVGRKAQEDGTYKREYEVSNDEKAKTLETNKQKNNVVIREIKQISQNNKSNGGTQPYQQDRVYDVDGISPALTSQLPKGSSMIYLNENQQKKFNPNIDSDKANTLTLAIGRAGSSSEYMDSVSKIANITSRIRRLTPVECERLQTVADNYTAHVSDSQRYKMLGNGWTISVIAHIFSYIK